MPARYVFPLGYQDFDRDTWWPNNPGEKFRTNVQYNNLILGCDQAVVSEVPTINQANYTDQGTGADVADPAPRFRNAGQYDYRLASDHYLTTAGFQGDRFTEQVRHDYFGLLRFDQTDGRSVGAFRNDPQPAGSGPIVEFELNDGRMIRMGEWVEADQGGGDSRDDFETGDFSALPWEHGGDAAWEVTSSGAYGGSFCARSGQINDSQTSTLSVTLDCGAGQISFWVKTSSESGYDTLRFFIDGEKAGEWSGELDWEQVARPIGSGSHRFEWSYVKDGSAYRGDDTAWIDEVEWVVQSP